jgi:hypothetical protein
MLDDHGLDQADLSGHAEWIQPARGNVEEGTAKPAMVVYWLDEDLAARRRDTRPCFSRVENGAVVVAKDALGVDREELPHAGQTVRLHQAAEGALVAQKIDLGMIVAARLPGINDPAWRILRLLGTGGLVLMTNNQYSGAMFLELPFGETGYVSLPTTTLNIAARHGVPLFALAAVERRPLDAWRVTIGPELAADPAGAGGRDRATLHSAMLALARPVRDQMLATFREAPEQVRPLGERGFAMTRFPDRRRFAPGPDQPA